MVTARAKIGEQLVRKGIIDHHQLTRAIEEQKKTGALMGKVLVELGMVKENLLQAFLEQQMRTRDSRRLGEVLVEDGLITLPQLDAALEMSQRSGQKLGSVLVKKGFLSELDLVKILSARMDVNSVDLEQVDFPTAVVSLLSEEVCRQFKVIPLDSDTQKLKLAMADPADLKSIDILRFKTSREIVPYMAPEKAILDAIDRVYRKREPFSRNSKDSLVLSIEKLYEAQKSIVELQEKMIQQQRTVLASVQDMLHTARNSNNNKT